MLYIMNIYFAGQGRNLGVALGKAAQQQLDRARREDWWSGKMRQVPPHKPEAMVKMYLLPWLKATRLRIRGIATRVLFGDEPLNC